MPSLSPSGLILSAVALLSSYACSAEDGFSFDERPQAHGQFDEAIRFVEVGETLAIEIEVLETDGSLSAFRWIWDTPESNQYTLETLVEKGRLSVHFTPRVPGRILLTGRAEVDRGNGRSEVVGIQVGDVRAYGGVASHALPAHSKLALVPGESRSTFAFPMVEPLGAPSYRTLGGDPVSYAIEDTSIASVSPDGRVTALAVGTTRLNMSYGSSTQSIAVEVAQGQLGDPAPSLVPIDQNFAAISRRAFATSQVESRMATNAQGWPVLALVFDALAGEVTGEGGESLGGQVVLAQWTGSGWGLELVSRPYDYADDAQVVIDEGGVPYVLYSSRAVRSSALHGQDSTDERSYVLAGRTGPASSYQHHDLPHGQDADDNKDRLADFGHARSLRARSGGGVWAVYTSSGTRYGEDKEVLCVDQLQLAELRGSNLRMHQVVERELDLAEQPSGMCPDIEASNPSGIDMMLDLLPRQGDSQLPSIISAHPWEVDCQVSDIACALPVNRFDPDGATFSRSNVLRSFDFEQASDSHRFSYLHLSAIRDPGAPSQPASILIGLDAIEASSSAMRTIVVNQEGATWFESPESEMSFGFRQDGYDYVGDVATESIRVVEPDSLLGAFTLPSVIGATFEGALDEGRGSVIAWAVSRQRLYLAQAGEDGLVLHSRALTMRGVAQP